MTDRPRKRQLSELKPNLFSSVLDAMADGVMVVDDQLRVVVTNRALREWLLWGPGSHGAPLAQVWPDPRLQVALEAALAGKPPLELTLRHRGLTDRTLHLRVLPLPDHAYWGHRALVVCRDETDRLAVEQLLRDFIANASHELRTPVTAIAGYAETLALQPPSDPNKVQQFHQTLHRHAQRLSGLIGQLLDLGRVDAGEWRLQLAPTTLGPLTAEVVEGLAEAAQAAGLSVQVVVTAGLQALADREALAIVLGNLLQNALKYTPPGGRVTVRARADGAQVRLSVSDSGPGIAPEHQERIFERFFRVEQGRQRRLGGVGLGLSIVQALVRGMNGRIEVQSRVGHGATFVVCLPRPTAAPAA
jgi:two-component system phosphate regulon sensor histidine kinase PhoR